RNRAAATARDSAIWLARRLPAVRRRLERLPLKPLPHHAEGLALRSGDGAPTIVGAMLPQPRVLDCEGRRLPLDEALGSGFALVDVDPGPGPAAVLADPLWERICARRLRLRLGERFPTAPRPAEPPMYADLDDLLAEPLSDCRGQVLLVRPDRFVVGAFAPADEEAFVAAWHRLGLGVPEGEPASVPDLQREKTRSTR
ncbi:MAG TPA: hypothetical protein VEB65_06125, partial [Solirubrobacterales bacterium]|nr:hypothetical protein [Solirubrobacterales bacterium]